MSSDHRKRSHRQTTSDHDSTTRIDEQGSNITGKTEGSPSNRPRYESPPLTSIRSNPTPTADSKSSSLSSKHTDRKSLPTASSHTPRSDQVLRLTQASGASSLHSTSSASLPPPHTLRSAPISSATDSPSMSAASSVSVSDAMELSDEESATPDVDQKGLFYMPTATSFATHESADPLTSAIPTSPLTSSAAAGTQATTHSTHDPSSASPLLRGKPLSRSVNPDDELLPCEVPECYYYIRPAEYNDHVLLHHYDIVKRKKDREDAEMQHYLELLQKYETESSNALQQQQQQQSHPHAHANKAQQQNHSAKQHAASAAASSSATQPYSSSSSHKRSGSPFVASQSVEGSLELVPCDFPRCGQMIDIREYAKHQRSHEKGPHPYTTEHGNRRYQPLQAPPSPADSSPIPRAASASPAAHSAAASSFNSPPSFPSPLNRVRSIGATFTPDRNFVSGIIEVLTTIFSTRKHLEVYLCSPIQFFYRSKTDGGFGCGYKNIQTLCSALLQFPLYQEILFEGAVRDQKTPSFPLSATIKTTTQSISAASSASPSSTSSLPPTPPTPPTMFPPMPPIFALQGYIDVAHQRGFDVVGGAQVGQLRNSKTWIGAVEAHALLCSYGTRSELIDFKSSCVGLMEYVYNYFHSRTKPVLDLVPSTVSGRIVAPVSSRADAILNSKIDTHARISANPVVVGPGGDATSASSSPPSSYTPPAAPFVPPLYFQHQGHSRTIIGIVLNQRTHRFRLLVLDPDVAGGGEQLLANLKSSNPQSALKNLYRGEDALKAKEYQMVMISSFGVMTAAEQQRSKRPFSTVISAIDEPRGATVRSSASSSATVTPSASSSAPSTVRFLPPGTPQVTDVHERGAGIIDSVRGGTNWKMERREVDKAFRQTFEPEQDFSTDHPAAAKNQQTWLPMHAPTRDTSDTSIQSNALYRESHFVPVIPPSRLHHVLPLPPVTNSHRDDSHVPTPSPCPPTNIYPTSASVSPPTTNLTPLSSGDRSGSGSKSTSRSRAASCSRIPAASRLLQLALSKKDAV